MDILYVAILGHIILLLSETVFVFTVFCRVLSREAAILFFGLWFDTTVDQNLQLSIRDKHANIYTNESEHATKTKKEYTMYVTGKVNKYE